MPYADMPAFIAKLTPADEHGPAARALAFIILTAARLSEALGATWDEIDFDTRTWTVPAARMKMGKPHAVPLSDAALDILKRQAAAKTDKGPLVFPGSRSRA